MISVAHNLLAMNAGRQLNINTGIKHKSTEKLSSGYRINRAADDAAGLSISEKMRRQIRGLSQASANTQDGISLCQVADGALNEVSDMLHRITELSVKAANGTNTQQDREAIQAEINQLMQEIDRVSDTTSFNEKKIFQAGESAQRLPMHDMQDSLAAEITANYVNGGDYQVTATENGGVQLSMKAADGTLSQVSAFDWSEIVNESDPSISLADTDIVAGTYVLEKNGIRLTFDVPKDSTKADVAEALDGAAFDIDKDVVSFNPVRIRKTNVQETAAGAIPGAETFFTSGPYSMHADEYGIWMENDAGTITTSKVTWSSMGVSKDTIAGKAFTYTCPDTGYTFNLEINSNATFQEVLDRLNAATVKYGEVSDYTMSSMGYDDWSGNSKVQWCNAEKTISETMIDSLNMTKVQRQDVHMICTGSGNSLADFKISINAADNRGNKLSNCVTQYLEPADQITKDFLAASTFNKGDEFTLTFGDGVDSSYSFKVRIEGDGCTVDDVFSSFMQNNFGHGFGFTINYMGMNIPLTNITHTDFDVSDAQWQNGVSSIEENKNTFWIHSGVEAGVGINVDIDAMNTELLGIDKLDVTTVEGAEDAMTRTSHALQKVNQNRSKIGAQQNRLEHTVKNIDNVAENTTAAESLIRDTDMATEMMKFSQKNILTQAGQAMLTQAQQSNQGVLSLLQ